MAKFSLIISCDPQFNWYENGGIPNDKNPENDKKSVWAINGSECIRNAKRQITQQYNDMRKVVAERAASEYPVLGTFVNGDLLDWGSDYQLDVYKGFMDLLPKPFYLMLGNHDYENVDGNKKLDESAAARLIDFFYANVTGNFWNLPNLNFDFLIRKCLRGALQADCFGSLAYSFDISSQLHVVMVNNYPAYAPVFSQFHPGEARVYNYNIKQAFDWLENDLALARNAGKAIIMNVHQFPIEDYGWRGEWNENWQRFSDLMIKYQVSAVFAGHIHHTYGYRGSFGDIPVFRSGAANYQTYLVAKIDTDANSCFVELRKDFVDSDINQFPDGQYSFIANDTFSVTLNRTVPNPPLYVPAPPRYITFSNNGAFVARYRLYYDMPGQPRYWEAITVSQNGSQTSYIPPSATAICVDALELGTGSKIDFEDWPVDFKTVCYEATGNAFSPKYAKVACP